MLESNLLPGSQPASADRAKLTYGVSVTDGCIGWDETEQLLLEAHGRLA
jgi:3-deoxy-7-phosphoheptulonate synthase